MEGELILILLFFSFLYFSVQGQESVGKLPIENESSNSISAGNSFFFFLSSLSLSHFRSCFY